MRLESLGKALTEETDKVLRAGPRLGYEVEVLRGEVRNLDETLHDKLEADISVFVPCGLAPESSKPEAKSNGTTPQTNGETAPDTAKPIPQEAEKETDMAKLRTLTLVRTRLDTVKSTFSNAMDWTFPPSEVSVSSGLISVSASEPGSEAASTEEKGQEVSRRLKAEIQELLSRADGVAKARTRISELRQLAEVWKGTAEEKARTRFIDSLERVVDERETEINRRNEEQRVLADSERPLGGNNGNNASSSALGGYGFMGQLGRIRGGI